MTESIPETAGEKEEQEGKEDAQETKDEKIARLEHELYESDDVRMKIQQQLHDKISREDDLQDEIENLKHQIEQLTAERDQRTDADMQEKLQDLEQQLIQSDAQKQKLS